MVRRAAERDRGAMADTHDHATPTPEPIVVPAGGGRPLPGPEGLVVKAGGADTGGSIAVLEATSAPGFVAPPHVHHDTDELFYVLDGTFEILVGDTVHRAPPGAFVFVPRGTVHSPRVAGDRPGRVLVAMVPGGAERAFDEFAEVAARLGDAFDPGGPEARAVARRYGSDLV
jgi:quercetin dioxygenase-like cupin family protein